jgi:hypothetical protein
MTYCPECGKTVAPNAKFCRNCGASQADEAGGPSAPAIASPDKARCPSCGSPLSPDVKFCGKCGAKKPEAIPVPAAVPASPAPKAFCAACSAPPEPGMKFCGSCGAPAEASSPAAPAQATPAQTQAQTVPAQAVPVQAAPQTPAAPAIQAGGEGVLGVVPSAKKMKFMGAFDTYTIVVTDRRMILAQMTQPMLKQAVAEAHARAKAEGKGFFGVSRDTLAASFYFGKRYETMPPDQSLQETPGNFAIENQHITSIKITSVGGGTDNDMGEFKMVIQSPGGKYEFTIAEDDRFTTLLKTAYGDRVHLPFGLFKAGLSRVRFF